MQPAVGGPEEAVLAALLLAGAVLAALPALGGGLLWWAGERGRAPSVVRAPGDPGAAEQDPPAADGRDRKDAGRREPPNLR